VIPYRPSREICDGDRGQERSAEREELYRWPTLPLSNGSLLAEEARPLGIEFPIGDQILHRHGVVPHTQTLLIVELVRFLHPGHVELNSEPEFRPGSPAHHRSPRHREKIRRTIEDARSLLVGQLINRVREAFTDRDAGGRGAQTFNLRVTMPTPGISPTPVRPSLPVRMAGFWVKKGPCTPLRFSSMLLARRRRDPAPALQVTAISQPQRLCIAFARSDR
jgi:hypothetical protein